MRRDVPWHDADWSTISEAERARRLDALRQQAEQDGLAVRYGSGPAVPTTPLPDNITPIRRKKP